MKLINRVKPWPNPDNPFFQGAKVTAAADSAQPQLNLGLILPHSIYNEREYNKAVAQTLTEIQKTKKFPFKFLQKFEFGHQQVHRIMMKVIPSPTGEIWLAVARDTRRL